MNTLDMTLYSLLGICACNIAWIFAIRPWRRRRAFKKWLKSTPLYKSLPLYDAIYRNVDTFSVARNTQAREKFPDDYAYIYGEIEPIAFYELLEKTSPTENDIFFDLGSGAGKAVFCAALFFNLKHSYGIERQPELFTLSQQTLEKFKHHALTLKHFHEKPAHITFLNENFLMSNLQSASIVFINATCYVNEQWLCILNILFQLPSGCRLIITSKEINSESFILEYEGIVQMSWGQTSARIYLIA